jgi:phosphohistidine phosphatase
LVLIRHAKAAQDGASDEARVLAPRGASDAGAVGRWLAEQGVAPDLVVVSPARRARQTWEAATASLGGAPSVRIDARIYDNTVEALLSVLNDIDESVTTLGIVGHNPSMHALAVSLDNGHGDAPSRAALAEAYPTSGIVVFDVDGAWSELAPRGASLRDFAVPRG